MAKVLIADAHDLKRTVASLIEALDSNRLLQRGVRVFLKPNLTYPLHLPGVTTTPAFMSAVMECLNEYGVRLAIGESDGGYGAWSADVAFKGHGLGEICRRYGAQLVNLSTAPSEALQLETDGGKISLQMPSILLHETDTIITLPVPKIHSVTSYSGAVKNQWGLIPDPMRLKLHPVFDSLIWSINRLFQPAFVLGDAQYVLDESGPIWGTPVFMNRIIASNDIYAFDIAVAKHVMRLDIGSVRYLVSGAHHGFSSDEFAIEDSSTGRQHRFGVKKTLRTRVVAAAFPHKWAVHLLWESPLGRLAHAVVYAIWGNRVAADRQRIIEEVSPRRHDVEAA